MRWNWQKTDWPNFTWREARLARAEEQFLLGCGQLVGSVKHMEDQDRDVLNVESMSDEAVTTSEIEGEVLSRESVQSSIRRQLGMAYEPRRVSPAEVGISEMMVDLYRHFAQPLDERTLFDWHRMVCAGRSDLRIVGGYRTHDEPMVVVSGPSYDQEIHFEAPPSGWVPGEMARFIEWFNRTGPAGPEPLAALTRAGVAHLYFESIHPFEDANGRIGRAISEKALAQHLGRPSLTALAATILVNRRGYYDALEAANKANEITDWLAWFAGTTIEAQLRALARIEFLIDKTKLLDRFRGVLNPRQEKAMLRVLREGPDGFKGGLSASNYVAITKASTATATRDLADLVERGALTRTGDKRRTRYHPPIRLRPVPRVTIDLDGEVVRTERA